MFDGTTIEVPDFFVLSNDLVRFNIVPHSSSLKDSDCVAESVPLSFLNMMLLTVAVVDVASQRARFSRLAAAVSRRRRLSTFIASVLSNEPKLAKRSVFIDCKN